MDWSLSLDSARERLKEAWDEGKKSLEEKATALTRLADGAAHSVADVEQRAIDAAGALADKIAERADAPLVKAAFERGKEGAATVADHYRHGGVARLAGDARHVVTLANQGASDALQPLVATAREAIAARQAVLDGDMHGALVHGANVANVAGHMGAPVEVAAFEAYRKAEKDGQSEPASAALKAAGEEMLSQANGLNPIYNGSVAGVEAHDAANKLLLERKPRAFFEHLAKGSAFFASAVAGVVGIDEASAGTEALTNVARTATSELESAAVSTIRRLPSTSAETAAVEVDPSTTIPNRFAAGQDSVGPDSIGQRVPRDTLVDPVELGAARQSVQPEVSGREAASVVDTSKADTTSVDASGTVPETTLAEVSAVPSYAEAEQIELRRAVEEIQIVNPGYDDYEPAAGRGENCLNACVVTDAVMDGHLAIALPSKGPMSVADLESDFGGNFSPTTKDAVKSELESAGPGSRAILYVRYDGRYGARPGHVMNVVNRNGFVLFLDGHRGREASFYGVNHVEMMWTKKGTP